MSLYTATQLRTAPLSFTMCAPCPLTLTALPAPLPPMACGIAWRNA